jgi:NADH-quinone oxidoreductase subunit C
MTERAADKWSNPGMTPEELKAFVEGKLPAAKVSVEKGALVVDRASLVDVMKLLRDAPQTRLDFLSSVTGVDWLGPPKSPTPCLEVVYHLYSVEKRTPLVVVRTRTGDRDKDTHVPSMVPLWRGAEYQEREAYDLYGVIFDGHPDLRRILNWDELVDFPMRKDYRPPEDYEWEPTPHDSVLEHAKAQREAAARTRGGAS